MFDIGGGELLLVLLIALLVFGPDKLEEFASKLGRLVGSCRKAWDSSVNKE